MGRDQDGNAARVVAMGLGRSLPPDASREAIRAKAIALRADDRVRATATRTAQIVERYRGGARAVAVVEALVR
jgi:UDP:flavonoid glycosyltransferase YjiC (YdhE family)